MRKRILIVSHWFYPRQNPRAFRAFELFRELSKKHKVDVLIGDWKQALIYNQDYHSLDKYNTANVNIRNAKLSNSYFVQLAVKIVQYFVGERYLIGSGKFLRDNIDFQKYDVVISIGLPFYTHWIVSRKLRRYKGKIVSISDWGDPFYGDPGKKIAPYFKRIQKKVCNTFDYIVTPTANAVDYYSKYTEDSKKIRVIPQGYNFDEVQLSEYRKHDVPHFAYAGIFYVDKRNPEKFLEFLTTIDKEFVFTIYTFKHGDIYQNILQKYQNILGGKLVINDMVPRLDCIKFLSENDFLINIDNISAVQVPSKLIDYTLSQRPILSFKQNEIPSKLFEEFLFGDYSNATQISIEEYSIESVCSKFEKLMVEEI